MEENTFVVTELDPSQQATPLDIINAFEEEAILQDLQNQQDRANQKAIELEENRQRFEQEWDTYLAVVLPLVPEPIRPFLYRYEFSDSRPVIHRHYDYLHSETIEFRVPGREPVICRLDRRDNNDPWRIKAWEVAKLRRDFDELLNRTVIVPDSSYSDSFAPEALGLALVEARHRHEVDRADMERELAADEVRWAKDESDREALAAQTPPGDNKYVSLKQFNFIVAMEHMLKEMHEQGWPHQE